MNRGSPERAPDVAVGSDRFNEAPIHESGKSVLRYRWHQPVDGLQ